MFYSILLGYFCGALPFALWIPRWLNKGDPRMMGSSSVGATNVYRLAGISTALIVYLCDVLKGLIPVLLVPAEYRFITGVACIVGHVFPWMLAFKGGKGVATASGVLMGIMPLAVFFAMLIWLGVWYRTRYVSLASLIAAFSINIFAFFYDKNTVFYCTLFMIFLLYTHRDNLKRFYEKREPRTGPKPR